MKSHTDYLTFNIPKRMDFVNMTAQVENAVHGCAVLSSQRKRSTPSPESDVTILTRVFSGEWKYCG